MKYKFYMQECDSKGVLLAGSTKKDLEVDFSGLKYSSMSGIETIGKAKNIATETFADSNRVKVYVPENITNEATKITFKCYFIGDNCMQVFDAFNEYIRKGFHRYWDTARNKWFAFYCDDEIKASTHNWKGEDYIEVSYSLSNIFGRTFDVE